MSRPRTPLLLALTLLSVGCSGPELLTYTVPMQEGAPWPRFRRTADNRGWSPLQGGGGQREVWSFATGKGIFSSPVVDYATAKKSDVKRYARFHAEMLSRGVYLAPSQFEAAFLSTAHTDDDIARTLEAGRAALAAL